MTQLMYEEKIAARSSKYEQRLYKFLRTIDFAFCP